jgi:hypothetical protein
LVYRAAISILRVTSELAGLVFKYQSDQRQSRDRKDRFHGLLPLLPKPAVPNVQWGLAVPRQQLPLPAAPSAAENSRCPPLHPSKRPGGGAGSRRACPAAYAGYREGKRAWPPLRREPLPRQFRLFAAASLLSFRLPCRSPASVGGNVGWLRLVGGPDALLPRPRAIALRKPGG